MTYEEIISNLENGMNFSFSRFGDGEFNCMYGKHGANCDGHTYFSDLGARLEIAWNNPKGVVALQPHAKRIYKIEGDYPDADVLHKASIRGELHHFAKAVTKRNYILVGPNHLKQSGVYDSERFIEVPLKNAWLSYPDILEEVNRLVKPNDVILYCCGMMAEVLIYDMYATDITQIDCGSVFDPYVGVKSRNYHHKLKL